LGMCTLERKNRHPGSIRPAALQGHAAKNS